MTDATLRAGDLVVCLAGRWAGAVGVVRPASEVLAAGVGVDPTFVFGRAADPGCEALSLSRQDVAVVVVGEPNAEATLLVESAGGRVWLWQGCCVVAVRPEPGSVSWRELDTPVVSMRGFDSVGAMAVVYEDGVLLLSPELETLRSWPTDLVTGVEWGATASGWRSGTPIPWMSGSLTWTSEAACVEMDQARCSAEDAGGA